MANKTCGSGKKLVKIKGRGSFCARTSKRKSGGLGGVSAARRAAGKAAHKRACATMRAKGWTGKRAKLRAACGGR